MKTTNGKLAAIRATNKANNKFPEKVKARSILNTAVLNGNVIKPKLCSVCNKNKKLDAHHADYSRPLDVKWVCRYCHAVV